MIIFPAVDIKDGRCVRLRQGKKDDVTVFSADPAAMAEGWQEKGAKYMHIVDLDGAFDGAPVNFELVKEMCSRLHIPVQLGGGIRDVDTAKAYVDAGVTRLLIGTMALEKPDTFAELCKALPGRIGVSLDAVDGRLKSKGWVEDSGLTIDDAVPRLADAGCAFWIYTDIARDGMHSGVNVDALEKLCEMTDLPVVAAGGVSTLEDVKALMPLVEKGLQGAITGRAIYEGTLDLQEAMAWIKANG